MNEHLYLELLAAKRVALNLPTARWPCWTPATTPPGKCGSSGNSRWPLSSHGPLTPPGNSEKLNNWTTPELPWWRSGVVVLLLSRSRGRGKGARVIGWPLGGELQHLAREHQVRVADGGSVGVGELLPAAGDAELLGDLAQGVAASGWCRSRRSRRWRRARCLAGAGPGARPTGAWVTGRPEPRPAGAAGTLVPCCRMRRAERRRRRSGQASRRRRATRPSPGWPGPFRPRRSAARGWRLQRTPCRRRQPTCWG